MTDKRMLMCFVTALAVMGAALSAHHSHAVYENSSIALKNATVTGLIWGNPHAILTFAVKDARGKAANWSAGRLAKVIFPDGRELLDSQNRNAVTQ